MKTYSFKDTVAAIVGPGGSFSIGAGAGIDEGGITIEPVDDVNAMTIGADGEGFHNLHASRAATITVRVLKTSPLNAKLGAMLAFQRTSAANWGQNCITIVNNALNDNISAQDVAFGKVPVVTYAKDGTMNEWRFDAINTNWGFGQ